VIRINKLSKRFESTTVLDGIDAEIPIGGVTALVGRSGGGKSTLLRCINGLERFDEGSIEAFGLCLGPRRHGTDDGPTRQVLAKLRTKIGMVLQNYGLFAHMTALANVMEAPVIVLGLSKDEARRRATALLDRVGMSHRLQAFPREMSGGEQQRVAIARALAMGPEVLLLDEPTAALDPDRKRDIIALLGELAKANTTLVIVSHEPEFLGSMVTQTIELRAGRCARAR
jgi:polar amino acid transport system ATP-binding protein